MKKIVLIVLCFVLHNDLLACGCDMLIAYQGIMPSDYYGMVGLNMRQRYFKGAAMLHTHSNGSEHEHGEMNQVLTNYELNYRFFIAKRWMLSGNIPIGDYQFSSSNKSSPVRNTGIADPIMIAKYELISPSIDQDAKLKQRLLIGSGLKLPLGAHYNSFINNSPQDENLLQLQLGSGSIDLIANVNYQIRKNNGGLQTDVSYKFNNANKLGYKKGNQWNLQANFFYQKRFQSTVLMPSLGLIYEGANRDEINKTILVNTGGNNIYGSIGAELFIKKITFFINYQQLIKQNLNGFQMKNNLRFNFGINMNLKFKNN